MPRQSEPTGHHLLGGDAVSRLEAQLQLTEQQLEHALEQRRRVEARLLDETRTVERHLSDRENIIRAIDALTAEEANGQTPRREGEPPGTGKTRRTTRKPARG